LVSVEANARLAAKSGPATVTSTGVGALKFMMRLTVSPGLERELGARKSIAESASQILFEVDEADAGVGRERHLQHPLVRPTGPQKNRVDRTGSHENNAPVALPQTA
jgi:hypothetical protein